MIYAIAFLVFALILVFWQASHLISAIYGAPVIYSGDKTVKKTFELAQLKPGQTMIDLGCGNAKSLIYAAREFKARGIGIEISPFYYLLAKINVFLSGESKNIRIIFGDSRNRAAEIQKADLVYIYSISGTIEKIEPWLFETVNLGTKIISVGFAFKKHRPAVRNSAPVLFLYQK